MVFRAHIHNMKRTFPSHKFITVLSAAVAIPSFGFAADGDVGDEMDQLKTTRGREYQKCRVLKVDPDGLTVTHNQGIAKISFTELDKSVQEKYGYEKEKADKFYKEHEDAAKKRREEAKKRAMMARNPVFAPSLAPAFFGGAGYASTSDLAYYFPRAFVYNNLFGQGKTSPLFGYPNLSYQLSPQRRDGNPIAPSLVGANRSLQQQRIFHEANGFTEFRIPTATQRIGTPAPRAAPVMAKPMPLGGMRGGMGGMRGGMGGARGGIGR